MRACEGARASSYSLIQKGKTASSHTSRVNRAELNRRGYMERDKMIIRAKETEKLNRGKRWQRWLYLEKMRDRKKETVGKQEEGRRKFLHHLPDPLRFSKSWNMTVHVLLFFLLLPTPPSLLFLFPGCVHVSVLCGDDKISNHLAFLKCTCSVLLPSYSRPCDWETCSYLMSSSRSHSVWCLKCSLVICSVWVFFSSCVTLTWRKQNKIAG